MVLTEVVAGLVDVLRMAKRSIILKEQLFGNDPEIQKTQHELQIAIGMILEAQHLPLNELEAACRYCQQLEDIEEQLDFFRGKSIVVEGASAEAAM